MPTTIPLLASAFALMTGSAVATGIRRILEVDKRFPDGSYRLVLGMHSAVQLAIEELVVAGE